MVLKISNSINLFKIDIDPITDFLKNNEEFVFLDENNFFFMFDFLNKKTGYYNILKENQLVKEKYISYETIKIIYLKEEKLVFINSNKIISQKIKRKLENVLKKAFKEFKLDIFNTFNQIKKESQEISNIKIYILNYIKEISYFGNIEIFSNSEKKLFQDFSDKIDSIKKIEFISNPFGKIKIDNPNSLWFSKEIDIFELKNLLKENE